jgi:DNA helicase II / ATP-dependent DNA helicase PcrA
LVYHKRVRDTQAKMVLEQEKLTQKKLLDGLNSAQAQAVAQTGAPLLVLAGAGSGKTKVLTHRIAYLIENGAHSGSILSVTFTNKAAKEMKERLAKLVGEEAIKFAWVGTFHSICARILRQDIQSLEIKAPDGSSRHWTKSFTIFDETDSVNVVKQAIKALDLDPKIYNPKQIKYRISESKNHKKLARAFHEGAINFREEKIAEIFAKYEDLMARNNALDFDDLLLFTVVLLQQSSEIRNYYHNRFKHILVDEYQDTNHTQYELVRLLAEGCLKEQRDMIINGADQDETFIKEFNNNQRTLTVVGDVDQSIYSWRGADFKIIIGFQKDYPNADMIKLEANYRSTAAILKVANKIIANNSERIEKILEPTKGEGDKITVFEAQDELEEAQYITAEIQKLVASGNYSLKNFAVLYRTNVQSRAIEEALLRRNIPYAIVGGFRFYDRKEIKDLLSYLKLIYNPSDGESLKRIINEPRRGIGATSVAKVEEYASAHGYSLYRSMIEIDDIEGLSSSAKLKIKNFVDLIESLRLAEKSLGLGDLVDELANKTGYIEMLRAASDAESESRLENVQEFIGVATDFELNSEDNSLSAYLAEVSLLSEQENTKKNSGSNVTLMTLHAAKGLEFPIVFLSGMEEGVFPHQRSLDTQDKTQLEEERRLMYVGVTRAEEKLYLTHARRRRVFGQSEYSIPSRFLEEAPRELLIGYYGQSSSNARQSNFNKDFDGIDDTGHWSNSKSSGFASTNNSHKAVRRAQTGVKANSSFYDEVNQDYNFNGLNKKAISDNFKVEFKIGDRVKHAKFGEGKILQVLGSGAKALYNIDFGHTKKLLDPKFAKLIKIS